MKTIYEISAENSYGQTIEIKQEMLLNTIYSQLHGFVEEINLRIIEANELSNPKIDVIKNDLIKIKSFFEEQLLSIQNLSEMFLENFNTFQKVLSSVSSTEVLDFVKKYSKNFRIYQEMLSSKQKTTLIQQQTYNIEEDYNHLPYIK